MSKNFVNKLPDKFTQNVLTLCKDEGEKWLNDLPEIISRLEEKWEIKVEDHFPNLSYNFVASCMQKNGIPAVLKIALPMGYPEFCSVAKTLQIFNGNGSVRFLNIDNADRAILLERLLPGKHLMEIFMDEKEKSVDVAIDVMKTLYQNSTKQRGFTDVDSWLYGLRKEKIGDIPAKYLKKAQYYFEEINVNKEKVIFIHGDLHHQNILSVGQNEFKAIDPFGCNANVGYEIGVFLRNHLKWVNNEKLLINAVEKFSDAFEMSVTDVKKWAYVQQVLSACWDADDGGKHWEKDLELSEKWENI